MSSLHRVLNCLSFFTFIQVNNVLDLFSVLLCCVCVDGSGEKFALYGIVGGLCGLILLLLMISAKLMIDRRSWDSSV